VKGDRWNVAFRRLPDDGWPFRGYSFPGHSAALAFNTKHKANASDTAAAELELVRDSWEAAAA
jgi:hypothetical protein